MHDHMGANLPDDELDCELARLILRTQIAQLQGIQQPYQPNHLCRIEFTDIQHAITPFNGDDSYEIHKWLADYNIVADSAHIDAPSRRIFARRLMSGSTEICLRSITADSWDILQHNLIREFHWPINRRQVYQTLSNRRIHWDESVWQYVWIMQDYARHADITENELIQ